MAKLRETIGSAVLDIEGDEQTIIARQRDFHRLVAEESLRQIDEQLAALRQLRAQRRRLVKFLQVFGQEPSGAALRETKEP